MFWFKNDQAVQLANLFYNEHWALIYEFLSHVWLQEMPGINSIHRMECQR